MSKANSTGRPQQRARDFADTLNANRERTDVNWAAVRRENMRRANTGNALDITDRNWLDIATRSVPAYEVLS